MHIPEAIKSDWAQIISGAVDVIPEAELVAKIEKSKKSGQPLRVKYGADPSAPDIHLGHTVPIRKLRQFQDMGHVVVFIIGDFTARIGDPTGKSETRKRLSPEEVDVNAQTYLNQIFKILDPDKTEVVRNSSWFDTMTFTKVIELGAKYTVARMLERDDFHKRFTEERPIFVHEFLYPLAQAWDSVEVRSDIEIGGTDQRFNLLVGREIQREVGQTPQCVLTVPLLVGTDGINKMSKSLGNYIGITESPREMFGKTMSIPDNLIGDYFLLALGYKKDEVDRFDKEMKTGALNPRDLKARLAREIAALYHSAAAAQDAEEEFNRIFREKELPDEIEEKTFGKDATITNILTTAGMAPSNREARRLITGGGVYIDSSRVDSPELALPPGEHIMKVGKRRFLRIIIQ
ncbi:MAG TPA: tyrosine--tRNA ligase [Candidatus Sumerlaeota bacterium]|nr:tyrosine--tRNA ligase [Candidatus Sumerlaeota bacterium]HOR63909.1 tyrosine--tRNA ligase [Candidatus Sumerlaeota bacterium]HPL75057.1 tyrosine--tRNA ligase [Candidatus Sumerlaeota bacterium]